MPSNILLILSDDQPLWTVGKMPFTHNLGGQGRIFNWAYSPVPVCQPARCNILTGQYGQRKLNLDNTAAALTNFDDDDNLAAWMNTAGYRTGLIGKYLNEYDDTGIPAPTGWDTWLETIEAASSTTFKALQYDSPVVEYDGATATNTGLHAVDWAIDRVNTFTAGSEPWFCYFAPRQTHYHYQPHEDDMFRWSWYEHPVDRFEDVSAQPNWIQGLPEFDAQEKATIQRYVRGLLRETTGLERVVKTICEALPNPDDTVIIFTSDNGLMTGQKRLGLNPVTAKANPFEDSAHMPLICAGPGFTRGETDELVSLVDITATCCAIGGATPTGTHATQDGVDLRDVQDNPGDYVRRGVLIQGRTSAAAAGSPDFDAVVTRLELGQATRKLIRNYDGGDADTYGTTTPEADISRTNTVTDTGGTTNLYAEVSEGWPGDDDASYIQTSTTASAADVTWRFFDLVDPAYSYLAQYALLVRMKKKTNTTTTTVTIELYNGASLALTVATQAITASYADYVYYLSGAEGDLITDFTDLRIKFSHGSSTDGMRISTVEFHYPTVQYASYDLDADPQELTNLTNTIDGYSDLDAKLTALLA